MPALLASPKVTKFAGVLQSKHSANLRNLELIRAESGLVAQDFSKKRILRMFGLSQGSF